MSRNTIGNWCGEYDEAATWYETQREGLGREFVAEIDRAMARA
jgi:hypothetical protein